MRTQTEAPVLEPRHVESREAGVTLDGVAKAFGDVRLTGVTRRFGDVVALRDVSLGAAPGEVAALAGVSLYARRGEIVALLTLAERLLLPWAFNREENPPR